MPLFIVEREFIEQFDPTVEEVAAVEQYHDANDIKWLTSFLSADKKKSYCLYECDNVEILRKHAADLGLPADTILEVAEFAK